MTTQQHTPAPWRIKRIALSKINAVEIIGGNTYNTVATLRDVYQNDPMFTEGIANARLIAAAPELLAALRDLTAAIKAARRMRAPAGHYDEDSYYNGIDFYAQLDAAREIIEKAEGNH